MFVIREGRFPKYTYIGPVKSSTSSGCNTPELVLPSGAVRMNAVLVVNVHFQVPTTFVPYTDVICPPIPSPLAST